MEKDMLGSGEMMKDMVKGHISMQMEDPKHYISDSIINLNLQLEILIKQLVI